jgi:hypothetical protein
MYNAILSAPLTFAEGAINDVAEDLIQKLRERQPENRLAPKKNVTGDWSFKLPSLKTGQVDDRWKRE